MFRTILVPLDGSTFGENALPYALSVARRSGADLQLIHVMAPLASIYTEAPLFLDDDMEARIKARQENHYREYLAGVAARLRAVADVPVETVLLEGDIPGRVRMQAEAVGADLIVLATHGRGPVARFWLGSVTTELESKAPCPLLLVHPHPEPVNLEGEPPLRNILVPLDGTPVAEEILKPATDLAQLTGAGITLARVVRPVLATTYPGLGGSFGEMAAALVEQMETIQEQVKKDASDYLERVAAGLRQRGLRVTTRVDVGEQPATAILEDAAGGAADLVAIETHARRGLSRLLLGSVADKVVRASHVPVLVGHPVH
jgi:nucleotide-binding universal stress UspA family protein